MLRFCLIFILPFVFLSCGSKEVLKDEKFVSLLEQITINAQEARRLSHDIQSYSKVLQKHYNLTPFANFNNFLINIGVKKGGLCWELAYDLLRFLKPKNYAIDFYIGGANIGSYWHEHNVLVLTCKGCKFESGVIVDIWRNGGELYSSKIKDDTKFSWKQRGKRR